MNGFYCPYCGSSNTCRKDIDTSGNDVTHCWDCNKDFVVEEA